MAGGGVGVVLMSGLHLGRVIDSSDYSPTKLDLPVAGSLDSFEPVTFPKISLWENYPNILTDSKTRYIDSDYFESLRRYLKKKNDKGEEDQE